jgi:30S ribosomal protein S31
LKARPVQVLLFFIPLTIQKTNIMGRGDIKTKKGKISAGSFGKSRPAKAKKATAKKSAAKKA